MMYYDPEVVCRNRDLFRVNLEIVLDNLEFLARRVPDDQMEFSCAFSDINKWLFETRIHLDSADISTVALAVYVEDKTIELKSLVENLLKSLPDDIKEETRIFLSLDELIAYRDEAEFNV